MSNHNTPSDTARETLKLLAARKLAPTPDNYAQVYRELSGEPMIAPASNDAKPILNWSELIRHIIK